MQTLNILGCGKVGRTLGKLWYDHELIKLGNVLNRTSISAEQSVSFMGDGIPVSSLEQCSSADIHMIAVSDDEIGSMVCELTKHAILRAGDVVFHCSGAISSSVLNPLKSFGVKICSIHPVKSFSSENRAAATFAGTYCAFEGEEQATSIVSTLIQGIGGKSFFVNSDNKLLYHGANVMVCNYLTTLLEIGIRSYTEAGLDAVTAMDIMEPIVRETIDNVFNQGTVLSLTGPVARGDYELVDKQYQSISAWDPSVGEIYRLMGQLALELSRQQGNAFDHDLDKLEGVLQKQPIL